MQLGTMEQMGKIDQSREKRVHSFLFFVYVVSVFIDIYNGYVQNIRGTETMLPVLYKGIILIYCVCAIFKDSKVLFYTTLFALLLACCIVHWGEGGYVGLGMSLVKDLTKLVYPFAILAYMCVNREVVNPRRLLLYIMLYACIASFSIIVTSILGVGVVSYDETYGYGTKGFFVAGNDLSVILIIANCIVSYFVSIENRFRYLIFSVIITTACMLIGSTAGIIGAVSNYVFLILQSVLMRKRISKQSKWLAAFVLIIGLPVLGIWINKIINTDDYTLAKFDIERLTSGGARNFLEDAFWQVANKFSFSDWIFGLGGQALQDRMGMQLGTDAHMVELDQYDIIGSYGVVLGGVILLVPIVYLCRYCMCAIRSRSVYCYWITIALGLFIFHGFTAGHAYMNIHGMTIIMSMLFLFQYKKSLV